MSNDAIDQSPKLSDDPAANAPPTDDVDPELLALSRPRRGRHPLVSSLVILLSLYLMFFMRADVGYFFQPNSPTDLGSLPAALDHPQLAPNRHVTLHAAPDRKRAVLIEGRLTGYENFFRLLQSRSQVFVQRHRSERSTDRIVQATHSGRLLRFADLPYAKTIRGYFARGASQEHQFALDQLAQALGRQQQTTVTDLANEQVTVTPQTPVWINVRFPGEWVIQLPKAAYSSAAVALATIQTLHAPLALDTEPSETFWRFVMVAGPDEARRLRQDLSNPTTNMGVTPRQLSYSAALSELRLVNDKLTFAAKDATLPAPYQLRQTAAGKQTLEPVVADQIQLPRQAILHISTSAPFRIPSNALVLVAGEAPADYWYYLALYALLLGFIGLNSIVIIRYLRERNEP